jgi:hypothetical protein
MSTGVEHGWYGARGNIVAWQIDLDEPSTRRVDQRVERQPIDQLIRAQSLNILRRRPPHEVGCSAASVQRWGKIVTSNIRAIRAKEVECVGVRRRQGRSHPRRLGLEQKTRRRGSVREALRYHVNTHRAHHLVARLDGPPHGLEWIDGRTRSRLFVECSEEVVSRARWDAPFRLPCLADALPLSARREPVEKLVQEQVLLRGEKLGHGPSISRRCASSQARSRTAGSAAGPRGFRAAPREVSSPG